MPYAQRSRSPNACRHHQLSVGSDSAVFISISRNTLQHLAFPSDAPLHYPPLVSLKAFNPCEASKISWSGFFDAVLLQKLSTSEPPTPCTCVRPTLRIFVAGMYPRVRHREEHNVDGTAKESETMSRSHDSIERFEKPAVHVLATMQVETTDSNDVTTTHRHS